MTSKFYAPVLIPTLNRYEHFKKLVESLSKCHNADKTDLIIGLDFPPSEKYYEGWNRIKEYVHTILGFNNVIVIEASQNKGAGGNFRSLINYVFEHRYIGFIASEDDNEVSPNFLDFMNFGIKKCLEDKDIIGVCGYNYDYDMVGYKYDYYYSKDFSAWGWATTCQNYQNIFQEILSASQLNKTFSFKKCISLAFSLKFDLIRSAYYVRKHNVLYGDVLISWYLATNNDKFCLFPKLSKVRNHGHDGSGLDCGTIKNNIFANQIIDTSFTCDYKNQKPPKIEVQGYDWMRLKYRLKVRYAYR